MLSLTMSLLTEDALIAGLTTVRVGFIILVYGSLTRPRRRDYLPVSEDLDRLVPRQWIQIFQVFLTLLRLFGSFFVPAGIDHYNLATHVGWLLFCAFLVVVLCGENVEECQDL
jgi:hypothetical protein